MFNALFCFPFFSFFFNDTATTEIYTLSLHDALPISLRRRLSEAIRTTYADLSPWERVNRSEEHTSELQSPVHLVCRLLLEKKNIKRRRFPNDLCLFEGLPVFALRATPGIFCFFLHDPSTTDIYTLSLHDALPIYDPLTMALFPKLPAKKPGSNRLDSDARR